MLKSLLRPFHPLPQWPSKPCQVAFGHEPARCHFTSPQQVHMTRHRGTQSNLVHPHMALPSPMSFDRWLHTVLQYLYWKIQPLFGMHGYMYKYGLASVCITMMLVLTMPYSKHPNERTELDPLTHFWWLFLLFWTFSFNSPNYDESKCWM